jgi:hypothetical protein
MHNSISDFLLDVIGNSIEADSRIVNVLIDDSDEYITCTVTDDGKGMNAQQLDRIRDPFYTDGIKHAKRKVGLGIPFLHQAAELAGGSLDIRSIVKEGTDVRFSFRQDHIDTPPVGDIPSAVLASMTYPGDFELIVTCTVTRGSQSEGYAVKRSELIDVLGELQSGQAAALLRKFIRSLDESLDSLRSIR